MQKSHELVSRAQAEEYLPSTEVREVMPAVEDEIHLKDYLDVIIRRRWAVIITLLVTFFSVAIFTFSTTPIYKAKATIKASPQGLQISSMEDNTNSMLKSIEFLQTQVELLKSERVLMKVIEKEDLENNSFFNPQLIEEEKGLLSAVKSLIASMKDMIRPTSSTAEDLLDPELERIITIENIVEKLSKSLEVVPKKNTQLIEIYYESPDARFSAQLINTLLEQYLATLMETKVASFKTADVFLEKQIDGARIKLEKSEQILNTFARKTGILSMDAKLNLVMKQLEELNGALANAVIARLQAESLYQQTIKVGGANLPQILQNNLIQELKSQHVKLLAEYEDLGAIFKPAFPKMVQLKAKIDDVYRQIQGEEDRILFSIRNQYESALENEKRLSDRTAKQKELAMVMNDKATQYNILKREVDSNKKIYDSLLQKSNEIEASIGAEVGNIEIIDNARTPAFPFKPKTMLNLLLGIVLGLAGGLFLAFGMEYMDNTVKNPDEFIRRYQIPILGLLPFSDKVEGEKEIAQIYYTNPRAPLAESIRTAMVSIELSSAGSPPKTILITSVLPNAGKSTIASNFSLSLLPSASRTLIIDTDLRKPTLHRIFGNNDNQRGLSSFLTGMASLEEVIRPTGYEGLDFISSGPIPPNPAELLASRKMRDFIQSASQQFDYIIIDAPPFHGFAEILILSNMVDGVILVAELNRTPREGIKYFKKAVTNVGGRILGVLINKVEKSGRGYGNYGGYKYYSYDYTYGQDET